MPEKCSYRVVMRKKSEKLMDIRAFKSRVTNSRSPLSVRVSVKPGRGIEKSALPGSVHIIIPTRLKTKITGIVYHWKSFFSGRPASQ